MNAQLSPKMIMSIVSGLIFAMILYAGYQGYVNFREGQTKLITLPIKAYYPKMRIPDNQLVYKINYGSNRCNRTGPAFMCLSLSFGKWSGHAITGGKKPSASKCHAYIKGQCKANEFVANIEHLQVPNAHHLKIKQVMHDGKAQVRLKVRANGEASVDEMLLDKKPWQEYLRSSRL